MNWYDFRFLAITFLIASGLTACQTPQDGKFPSRTVQENLESLDDGEVLAEAFVQSPLYGSLANYPITVFYIFEEQFTAYLSRNGLTEESFLQSDELNDFLGSFVIENIHLAEAGAGTYMTKSGDAVEVSDVSDSSVGGGFALTANGKSASCELSTFEGKSGSFCFIQEPLVDFSW